MTASRLRQAQARFERAEGTREAAREERNRLVREAREEGWSLQQIADAAGLTRSRLSQIIRGEYR